ncbi:hypothetical protein NQ314_019997 [Rhamnusium bicolor]|uniref:Uncharacterized protein n=1 Tax=Rhamnusium bicolor TaxID=1586634 RepID=A0AAV8WMM6_9CUCU|nr:hypothetical protein NQ314_019997 [Rhamnusium bicolor]
MKLLMNLRVYFAKNTGGEHNQNRVKTNLFNGKYKDNGGLSREAYIMRKYYNAKHLEPKMDEGEIVKHLSRHFDDDIRRVIVTQRIGTIEGLIEYIRVIDDDRTEWRRLNNRQTYGNNNQNYDKREWNRNYQGNQNQNFRYQGDNRDNQYQNQNYRTENRNGNFRNDRGDGNNRNQNYNRTENRNNETDRRTLRRWQMYKYTDRQMIWKL